MSCSFTKLPILINMAIHIGKKIKEVLTQSKFTATEFAVQINKTRTVVYDIFKRSTIDTGLLQKISKVLNYDFFADYSQETFSTINDEKEKYITKISELEKQNSLLEKLNDLLEEKRKK
jgi:hypothetical protein